MLSLLKKPNNSTTRFKTLIYFSLKLNTKRRVMLPTMALNGFQSFRREETNVKRVLKVTRTKPLSKSKKSNNEVYIILKNKLIYLCMQSKEDMELDEQFDEKDHEVIEEDIE